VTETRDLSDEAGAVQQEQPQPDAPPPAADEETVEVGEPQDSQDNPEGNPEGKDTRSLEDLRTALAEAERLRDEYLDQLRRARADYENLNKRKTRELMDALDRGAASLVSRLLGVLDNFALALDAVQGSEDERLAKGVGMVHAGLLDVLTEAGLEEVPGVGAPFDPKWHEALIQVEAAEALGEPVDSPVVAEVLRTGYRFKGRVLRPASVKVAR
jgi:molecular chaperone GrpE